MGGDLKGILEALVIGPFCTGLSSASPHPYPFLTFPLGFREATALRPVGAKPGKAAGGRPRTRGRGNYNYITQHPARRRHPFRSLRTAWRRPRMPVPLQKRRSRPQRRRKRKHLKTW